MGVSVHLCVAAAGPDPRAAAHALLLELAGTLVDAPTLAHDDTGRPLVPGLAVSVTHTHHLVAVAAALEGPLGIDLEELHPRAFAPLANRWYSPPELEWLRRQPDQLHAFLTLWTAKEAVGKALGLGLRKGGLRRQMPLGRGVSKENVLLAQPVAGLAVLWVPVDGVVLAVAAGAGIGEVVVHQEAALRRAERSRTSFPVVVRGN
ncbi:4'-phosphopantetheinyl transferase family protein [Kribbella sp. NPDC004536]|uniref:4'-phosphopantetheinyl transferase family protein n=1 Tax=Kribbella sp. NPDC004536 TaxID=3364106 RepID=UPI0036947BB6